MPINGNPFKYFSDIAKYQALYNRHLYGDIDDDIIDLREDEYKEISEENNKALPVTV